MVRWGTLTLIAIGDVVSRYPEYHSFKHIYPVGFCAQRIFWSADRFEPSHYAVSASFTARPNERVIYRMEIIPNGDRPVFQVICSADTSVAIRSPKPRLAWATLSKRIAEMKAGTLNVTRFLATGSVCMDGAVFFGLTERVSRVLLMIVLSSCLCSCWATDRGTARRRKVQELSIPQAARPTTC